MLGVRREKGLVRRRSAGDWKGDRVGLRKGSRGLEGGKGWFEERVQGDESGKGLV